MAPYLTNFQIPRPNGKFCDHEKWFLTYLTYLHKISEFPPIDFLRVYAFARDGGKSAPPLGLNRVNFLIVSTFFLFPCFLLFLFHFMFGMRAFVCEREIECLSVTFPQNLCLGQIPRGSGKKFSLENIYYIIQEFLSANIANVVFGRKKSIVI